MSWSPEASFEPHKLRLGPAMGGDKICGSSFNLALVKKCCGPMKSKRIDSVAQLK